MNRGNNYECVQPENSNKFVEPLNRPEKGRVPILACVKAKDDILAHASVNPVPVLSVRVRASYFTLSPSLPLNQP